MTTHDFRHNTQGFRDETQGFEETLGFDEPVTNS